MEKQTVKFIDYEVCSGKENMQRDADLLEDAILTSSSVPVFRLYGWSPACVSLGRNQNGDFIDKELFKTLGVDCVRRLTGGRALLHDEELTYSYISPVEVIPNGESVSESYKYISGIWVDIFNELGVNLSIGGLERHVSKNNYCMAVSTGADLCWNNRKFIGSAQCRKNGYILQHGSILLDYNKDYLNKIFKEDTDFSTIVALNEIDNHISLEDIIKACKHYFNAS